MTLVLDAPKTESKTKLDQAEQFQRDYTELIDHIVYKVFGADTCDDPYEIESSEQQEFIEELANGDYEIELAHLFTLLTEMGYVSEQEVLAGTMWIASIPENRADFDYSQFITVVLPYAFAAYLRNKNSREIHTGDLHSNPSVDTLYQIEEIEERKGLVLPSITILLESKDSDTPPQMLILERNLVEEVIPDSLLV